MKFTQFLTPFLKPQGRLYPNFASLFSFVKGNYSVFFLAQILYTLDEKSPSKIFVTRLLESLKNLHFKALIMFELK